MTDTKDSFLEQMKSDGVKPIRPKSSLNPRHRMQLDADTLEARQRAATQGEQGGLTTGPIEWLNPLDPIEWRISGVQEGVYRNLRLGKYDIDARLDISSYSIPAARDELLRFIKECIKLDIRTVIIFHGRGKSAKAPGNKLKSYLNLWLRHIEDVMAFHSSQPQHGGTAATYLLLRKSQQARLNNLEKHQKRRA